MGRLNSEEQKEAYKNAIDELIKGVIHSILVMIDGEDELADNLKLDLIDESNRKSLKSGCVLHEEFF